MRFVAFNLQTAVFCINRGSDAAAYTAVGTGGLDGLGHRFFWLVQYVTDEENRKRIVRVFIVNVADVMFTNDALVPFMSFRYRSSNELT